MPVASRQRTGRRMGAWARGAIVPLVAGAVLTGACMETRRSLGEDCLKDGDCLSGVCAQFLCAAASPTIDTQVMAEAGPESASGGPDIDSARAVDGGDASEDASGNEIVGESDARSEQDEALDLSESSTADASTDGDGSGD
jgi:hypothetical protein